MRVLFLLVFLYIPTFVSAQVIISEIFYDSAETPEHNYEFVEIYNSGSLTDISGWVLQDDSKEYVIPDGTTLDSGAYFIINRALVSNSFSLKNTGETLVFKNGSEVQDTKVYEDDAEEGQSLQKQQDGTWQPGTPTPGSGVLSSGDEEFALSDSGQTQTNIITTEVTKYNTVTIEPPQDIYLRLAAPELTNTGVQTVLYAEVYDATGKAVSSANVEWSFGDGATARGAEVQHRYAYPGTYAISAYVKSGTLTDETSVQILVVDAVASVHLSEDFKFVEVFNSSKHELNVSGWILRSGYKHFYIPERTLILAASSVRFSTDITKLSTLKMEKHVLLLDSARNMVADSREYAVEELEQEPEEAATTTNSSTTTDSKEEVIVVPSIKFVQPPPPLTPQPSVSNQEPEQQKELTTEIAQPQLASAVVGAKSTNLFDSGVEWLLGLLGVVGFGIFTLKSFSTNSNRGTIDESQAIHVDEFRISEIK